VLGVVAADFVSGLVHWGADTWGRDDTPVLGSRLLVPFRVHHVNPDDFQRRHFIDVNGDVAILAIPVLAALLRLGLETSVAAAAGTFGFAFCAACMLTNQIHQWAHLARPPRPVRWLQACGVLLTPSAHARHHDHPYDVRYCITTGWCNRPLEAMGFFRGLEAIVRALTRAEPRRDDGRYRERYGSVAR
jgi:ubiquitin-conjugating enzyme E2 variant